MNENYFNQRKMRSIQVPADLNKNGHSNNGAQVSQNFSHNNMHTRQPINQTPSGNHIQQNMLPQLVNLISPQISVSQTGNQPMINMGFNATPFLPNQVYSLPNTFGALNTMSSQGYGSGNVSYMNNIRLNNGPPAQSVVNYKDQKSIPMVVDPRKPKADVSNNNKVTNYPVRLLVNSELVGPLIGRKGEKIKEITATTGAKIDIKRESVPYSQFGLNNYMFSGSNRKGSGSGDNEQVVTANNHTNRGESQIVFIVGDPEKCSAAIQEIMHLCTQEAAEQGREEPNLGLLAEDRFCARIIGKEGRYLNFVRCKSNSQVHVSNVPTITTLSQQPHIISLDRIVSCRGGGLPSLLEAERLISEKVRQCVAEDGQNVVVQKSLTRLSKDDSFLPPRAAAEMNLFSQYYQPPPHVPPPPMALPHFDEMFMSRRLPLMTGSIGSGIVHKANPNWPDNLKLDENLYVRIAQMCAGSIIGSEGKSVKRIMADTGTYIQISKANLSAVESVPAVHTYRKMTIPSAGLSSGSSTGTKEDLDQRLVTIKGSVPSQCSALAHIFNRVKICYNQSSNGVIAHDFQDVRLWVMVRVPKLMLGRLIGKDGKVIRQLQLNSRTFLSFPRLRRVSAPSGDVVTDSAPDMENETAVINDNKVVEVPEDAGMKRNSGHTDLLHNPDQAIFGDADLHPVEIFGSYDAVESAVFMIRRLIYSCIFAQYGPALIQGPVSPVPLGPGPMQPTFLVSPMMPWSQHQHQQRRGGDFPNNAYFNQLGSVTAANIGPRTFGPTAMSLAGHANTKNFKRPQYSQRVRGDRRSQSDTKPPLSRNESDENGGLPVANSDNGIITDSSSSVLATSVVVGEDLCGSEGHGDGPATDTDSHQHHTAPTIDSGVPGSPMSVLINSRPDADRDRSRSPDTGGSFCQTGDDLSQRFVLGSPPVSVTNTSYYTDCSPGGHGADTSLSTATNNSHYTTLDEISFLSAQDNVGESPFDHPLQPSSSQCATIGPSLSHWSQSSPKGPF